MASSVSGAEQVIASIRGFASEFRGSTARALLAETELLATQVKDRTPVDTGVLRSSVHVQGPFISRGEIETLIVAGGPASPYALIVHENLTAHHPVGQAKYIESVLDENARTVLARVADRVRAELGS